MRKIVLSGVAALGLLIVGTVVVVHPSNVRQAEAATGCVPQTDGRVELADLPSNSLPQRQLVAATSTGGLAHTVLVSYEQPRRC